MSRSDSSRLELLRTAYERGGFVRVKMEHRLAGHRSGWELRLATSDEIGLRLLQACLRDLGFDYGSHYRKGKQAIIPLYGKQQVERFLQLIKPSRKSTIPQMADRKDMRFKPKPRPC